eukprot:TRINITY_DN49158_c0_g1_i1.p1 TRINITY_DN49158_c0_g1~~TRINITY_DN49158_c0_g1_i1.p1  ORF type:complete len:377 (-),score=61.45 TRINITY_DN49158_c0_g1_i1:52-1182(-)
MRISIRPMSGAAVDVDVEPSWTVAELKQAVEKATGVPVTEQRLIYAGSQLEEVASETFRQRRSATGGEVSQALGALAIAVGSPLRLDHYAMQKGSVVMLARRAKPGGGVSDASGTATNGVAGAGLADAPAASTVPAEAATNAAARAMPAGGGGGRASGAEASGYSVARPIADTVAPPVLVWEDVRQGEKEEERRRVASAAGAVGTHQAGASGVVGRPQTHSSADTSLTEQLDAMGDLELQHLIGPLLRRRPALRAALLAEDNGRPVTRPPAASASSSPPAGAPVESTPPPPAVAAAPVTARAQPPIAVDVERINYFPGEAVMVWSNSARQWFSGHVVRIAQETEGLIPKGSVEVAFRLGHKWIPPHEVPTVLRRQA